MNWDQLLTDTRIRPSQRQVDARSAFESDFGRIIFSPATRRMHAKTQVFPLTDDDNIHSRLTHSMEVMSIGYSLSIRFCESPVFQERTQKSSYELFREISVILKNACLIHDIGNPPFGHFGETVMQGYFKEFFARPDVPLKLSANEQREFVHFDGNAQGLRVLTKLQSIDDCYGLNLTCPTLAACLKYPNCDEIDKSRLETKKVGVYQSEKEYLNTVVEKCGLLIDGRIVRHPLCYLVEAADSICYLTMDLEDGFGKKLYTLEMLRDAINEDFPEIKDFMAADEPGRAKITKLRNALIAKLVELAFNNFEQNIDAIENGTFNQELIFSASPLADHLQKFCIDNIFSIKSIYELELVGHNVLTGLLNFFIECLFIKGKDYRRRALKLLSDSIIDVALRETGAVDFENLSDYYKLRVLVDYLSGMTDRYALNLYRKVSGMSY
ncbi:MAG: dNTP triphosphohydrolase [Bacteroidales bacterium]|nr:dNTP triphosphohydrolase [Bacteroidales bacterium]